MQTLENTAHKEYSRRVNSRGQLQIPAELVSRHAIQEGAYLHHIKDNYIMILSETEFDGFVWQFSDADNRRRARGTTYTRLCNDTLTVPSHMIEYGENVIIKEAKSGKGILIYSKPAA